MRKIKLSTALCFSLVLIVSIPGKAAERAKAKVVCEKTDTPLVYDCQIMLVGKKSGIPIEGAEFEVSADMPSMPMAHNVKPATAVPGEKPGVYRVRIELAMHGEWVLKLDLKKPLRDRLISKLRFGKEGASSRD